MITDFDKIVKEWSYRVHNSKPNPQNSTHQYQLTQILVEYGWPYQAIDELIQNLNEIDIVQKKQADGSYGSSYTVKKHNPDRGQKLIKKDASKDDIEKVKKDKEEDKPEKIKSGEPNQKDKSLKQNVETSKSETYSTTDTGIDDKEFSNQPEIEPVFENESDELRTEDIEKFFESGRIPKKYAKVITRLLNSEKGSKTKITNFLKGVGAGELQAQAGEIVTMASVGMNDDEFEEFINILEKQVEKYPKGSKPIVTKDWLDSVRAVRTVTKKRLDKKYGKGNWKIKNTAWDVKEEFNALGNDDYENNKGFSSDMYAKIEVDGKDVLDEISLKKDSVAKLFNGAVTEIKKWSSNVPPEADVEKYKKGEIERPIEYGKKAKTLDVDESKLLTGSILEKENKALRSTLVATGVIRKNKKGEWEMNPSGRKIIQALEQLEVPPPIDSTRFKDEFGSGAQDRFKKGMIIHAAISAANGDKEALDFLNKQIGYAKGEDGKFPEGSIKRYQNDTVQFLVDDEEAKEGLLNALAEKLPLKSMIEGEEAMAIGGLSADPATLKRLFGVDNYKDFKAGLTIKEDEDGNNYLVYESKAPAKEVKISEVRVRQKGLGYASSVGLEFEIAKDFAQQLHTANKEEYPPEPEISDKEKRRLGIS
jgi:predicted transcriptional regulator